MKVDIRFMAGVVAAWLSTPAFAADTGAGTSALSKAPADRYDDGAARFNLGAKLHETWARDRSVFPNLPNLDAQSGRNPLFDGGPGQGAASTIAWGNEHFSLPVNQREWILDQGAASLQLNSLGVRFAQTLDAHHEVSVGAQYGDFVYTPSASKAIMSRFNASSVLASVGISGDYGEGARVGTRLFLGNDAVDEQAMRYLGRRYYGLVLDGSVSLFKNHMPFVSLSRQWSAYDEADPVYLAARSDDYAGLSAGWNWQVYPNWRLRAEANRISNASNLSLYGYDQHRLFFSTRFDFR